MSTTATEPRITDGDYYDADGLSFSGMKDLAVSPLRYWHLWINPERPVVEPTPAMQIGSALHCAVLEPSQFQDRYCCKLVPPEDVLTTIKDLRGWLESCGVTPNGSLKSDIIRQVERIQGHPPILDVLEGAHAERHAGKIMFSVDDWQRINGSAKALLEEPRLQEILNDAGASEVPLFANDPKTGVVLKAKPDWVTQTITLDLKTFSQQRGKSIDKSVTDAVYYERYHHQAWFYALLRSLCEGDTSRSGPQKAPTHVLAFVESDEPHEVRIRSLRPRAGTEANMLWLRAGLECRSLIRLYADCLDRFGDKPWRTEQSIEALVDEEFPQLAYS